MTHRYPQEALRQVLDILDETGAVATTISATFASDDVPTVRICFMTYSDVEAFAKADGANLATENKGTLDSPVLNHYGMYNRPGRRMLIQNIETGVDLIKPVLLNGYGVEDSDEVPS